MTTARYAPAGTRSTPPFRNMLSTRKVRVFALAVSLLVLVGFLYFRREIPSLVLETEVPGSLVDSSNNAKLDAAINHEIQKTKEGGDVSADPGTPKSGAHKDVSEVEAFDPKTELIQIRLLSPMTVFSKSYCPFSAALKQLLLENYDITPTYNVVELDKHEHGKELQDYLYEVTKRRTVPNVLVGKSLISRGGSDDFKALHKEDKLVELLKVWGDGDLLATRKGPPSNA